MGIVDDLLSMRDELATDRSHWESAWRDCVDLAMPYASWRYDYSGSTTHRALTWQNNRPRSVERSRDLYDSSMVWASERLSAGMESMIVPRAQKWHTLSKDDPFADESTDTEQEWLDKTRDYLFSARYDSRANFALSIQKAIRSTVVLGTGVVFSDENMGRRGTDPVKTPFFYRHVPLIDCYLGIDPYDDVDRNLRVFEWTARQAVEYFGEDKVSAKVRDSANDPKKQTDQFTFMHAVMPREHAGEYKLKREGQLFASFWIEIDQKHLISHGGYFTFPYQVYWWDQSDGPYGQSPIMSILADGKMLQHMSKTALQAGQQMIKPPMATMQGIYNTRLNLNSGAVNPGYLDQSGRLMAQPIVQGQDPSLVENLLEQKRQSINESMYITLFQTLVDNPQMTATEAIIRANERGELLGPAGAKTESGLGRAIDREIDIIQRKGAFEGGSPLAPPESMFGQSVGVKFTGPLARLRRMQELQGVQSVMEIAGMLANAGKVEALDKIDADETLDFAQETVGAPRKMFKTDDEVAAERQARAQQMEMQAQAAMAESMARTAKDATPAVQAMAQATGAAPR